MKIGMTRGTKRMLDIGRRHDGKLDATLLARIDEELDGSSEDTITAMIHSMPCGDATLQFFLEADMDKVTLAVTYLTTILAIDAHSMTIHGVPETKRTQHQARASAGFDAREVVDMELLDGVRITRVVDAGAGSTLYLLDHEWNLLLTHEEADLCY
ncbi:hypothetical protein [uncultured Salinicola sp.]|uniref:hypothetical protein n=1 Tax=uncultured Salinicola sp. TaxID=1193542 RepID=UPI002628EE69|nr:hypothetical protein [uncultured Salinicola sp.]